MHPSKTLHFRGEKSGRKHSKVRISVLVGANCDGLCCVVGFKANCPLVGPGLIGGVPSVGIFLRDPSPYLLEFWRKPRKTPNS